MNVWKSVGNPVAPTVYDGGSDEGLIGREREAAVLRELLTGHHLVTVTGRPGMGKSRLAVEAAARPDGPWRRVVHVRWQGSGPGGPGALTAAVCQALTGRRPHRRESDIAAVLRHLPATGILLFLDDIDPVHRECIGLVQRLLVALPALRVLVTSRRVLGLGEEQVLVLPPLATRSLDTSPDRAPAVELFLRRARAVTDVSLPDKADLPADASELLAVEAICRSLEGVPHAIELAAEQVAHQPVDELADLLESHQCWLSSGQPVLRRHRSPRDTIGASYALFEREASVMTRTASRRHNTTDTPSERAPNERHDIARNAHTAHTAHAQNLRSGHLGDRFKGRNALHVVRHRKDVGRGNSWKRPGQSLFFASRPLVRAPRASNDRHDQQPSRLFGRNGLPRPNRLHEFTAARSGRKLTHHDPRHLSHRHNAVMPSSPQSPAPTRRPWNALIVSFVPRARPSAGPRA
ncbi:AAA family ATPase [Streptomyces prunicolor]|uniref:AAA family ATPase n=1 Tax=Streptomyces prunicolor TaxID=67348 RepID=UPI003716F347